MRDADDSIRRLARADPTAPALAYRLFAPRGAPLAAVLVSTGYFDNMARYRGAAERWAARGLLVATYDLRGHGLSEGRRGAVGRFQQYVDDALDLLDALEHEEAWSSLYPPLLFGHSFGGLVSIHVGLAAPRRIAGLALTSPYLGSAVRVPGWKLVLGHLLSRALPSVSLDAGLEGADCTRSGEIAEAYDHDPMNFKKANVRWFTETLVAQRLAFERAGELTLPVVCLQAGDDKIAEPLATERFMERVGGRRRYERLPGHYHELLNEPDRAARIDDLATAMLELRSSAEGARAGAAE